MAHTLGGVTVHVYKDTLMRESLYAQQNVLDATDDSLSFYGAKSRRRRLQFTLLPETSGTSAYSTLDAAAIADADVAYVSDQGSEGNWRILSFNADRLIDISRSSPVWDCTAELVKS